MSDIVFSDVNKAGIQGCRFAFLKRLGGVGDMNAFKRLIWIGPQASVGMSMCILSLEAYASSHRF